MGTNPSEKLKKQKESRILALESRMTALMFWNDASGEYTGEVDTKLPARKFPSTDMVHYFHPIAWVRQMKLMYYKRDIDLREKGKWQTQFDVIFGNKAVQNKACWKACQVVLSNYNVNGGHLINGKALYQIGIEKNNSLEIDNNNAKLAIKYLDEQLELGKPIIVGVDHTYKYKGGFNNDKSTDHFVIIIGRGSDETGDFYRFYEVGTSYKNKGMSDENKLYVKMNSVLKGKPVYNAKHEYTVIQIRKNN